MATFQWVKYANGDWPSFDNVDLSNVTAEGVYVIWFAGAPPNVVRVGQGKIASRLSAHRNDKTITAYRSKGALLVTWAAVPAAQRDGVEKFLADQLNPRVGDAFPNVAPIAVNLPG